MIVSLIAAASENNVIGKDNWMPWDLPAELAYFRAVTKGKPVIMGRKTYDSVGRPMPGRHNIVISRNADLKIEGVDVVSSMEEALEVVKKDNADETFVTGGEHIYKLAMPYANRIYLTRVHTTIEGGEAFFPEFDESEWSLVKSEKHEPDAENKIPYTIMVFERTLRQAQG
jgi:dihydrofolate reductase